ncbi:unnamed protein product [Polarella glacialis]|uniref:Uncharacterized protein n=1 Tax=Polarella glacialis TaxID=89957 RepID=A0A813K5P5_POLGL|nr:unnamed protein product [Polarella glacialis]
MPVLMAGEGAVAQEVVSQQRRQRCGLVALLGSLGALATVGLVVKRQGPGLRQHGGELDMPTGPTARQNKMSCGGEGILCGVLALESGQGSGYYKHKGPAVHGLWPEVKPYGDSACVAPGDKNSRITSVPICYQGEEASADPSHEKSFLNHEWTKHGSCAGADSANGFFATICSLAQAPLEVMTKGEKTGSDIDALASDLRSAGFPVFSVDKKFDQVMLSACASKSEGSSSYVWKLAPPEKFAEVCGGGVSPQPSPPTPPSPGPSPSPPTPSGGKCMKSQHGPACQSDSDCTGLAGCLRCAKSGFCTSQPLQSTQLAS